MPPVRGWRRSSVTSDPSARASWFETRVIGACQLLQAEYTLGVQPQLWASRWESLMLPVEDEGSMCRWGASSRVVVVSVDSVSPLMAVTSSIDAIKYSMHSLPICCNGDNSQEPPSECTWDVMRLGSCVARKFISLVFFAIHRGAIQDPPTSTMQAYGRRVWRQCINVQNVAAGLKGVSHQGPAPDTPRKMLILKREVSAAGGCRDYMRFCFF